MSAWLTGEIGLSIITNFLREKHYKKNKICDQQIFNELLAVNLASLIARYGSIDYEYSKYKYQPLISVDENQVVQTISSYLYQSCEIDNFEDVEIIKFILDERDKKHYQKILKANQSMNDLSWDIDRDIKRGEQNDHIIL